MRTLVEEGYRVFLEIGPRPVLSGMATRFLDLRDTLTAAGVSVHRLDRREALDDLVAELLFAEVLTA